MSRGLEMCFQTLWAPNFRDHDGIRTVISTDQGLKPITEVKHRVWERLWLQDFDRQAKTPFADAANRAVAERPNVAGELVMVSSRDQKWLVAPTALSGPAIRLFNNREYSCMHCNPSSILAPREHKSLKQRIYFLRGSPEDLVKRYTSDVERERPRR